MSNRVVHFEITAEEPERAVKFYKETFGWSIQKYEAPKEGAKDYWLVTTGPVGGVGINGGMFRKREPFSGYVNIIDVESLEESARKITENGGKQITPKITIKGVGYTAYFSDTEGNAFGIIEENPKAE